MKHKMRDLCNIHTALKKKNYISYAPIFHCVRCNIALGKWLSRWMYLCIVYLSSTTTNHILNERVGFYSVSKWINMCVWCTIFFVIKRTWAQKYVYACIDVLRFACSIFFHHIETISRFIHICISHTNKHIYFYMNMADLHNAIKINRILFMSHALVLTIFLVWIYVSHFSNAFRSTCLLCTDESRVSKWRYRHISNTYRRRRRRQRRRRQRRRRW